MSTPASSESDPRFCAECIATVARVMAARRPVASRAAHCADAAGDHKHLEASAPAAA